jgi:hypothetical protein
MPILIDPRTGEVYSSVPDEEVERARSEFGLVSEPEYAEHQANTAADTKGPLGLIAEGATRGLGHIYDAPEAIATGLLGDTGKEAGLVDEVPRTTGADLFPESFSPEARRRTQMHPVYEGLGTGLATAPFAAGAAALAPPIAGLGALGTTVGALGAEAVVEAVAQEYDDSWLEQRPMELTNVAAYTAMFGVGDVVLRGVGKGLRSAMTKAAPGSALGKRNIVAEAQAAASRTGEARAAQSVGAASAREMSEPFDEALATMSDRDATVLARDSDDLLKVAAMHSADDMTRVARGLSESLGSQLKYRDVQIAVDALKPQALARQSQWASEVVDQALGVAESLEAGGPSGLALGNAGKQITADIRGYARQIMDEADPAKRFFLLDNLKKRLDQRVMAVGRDWHGDSVARGHVLETLQPLLGDGRGMKGALREGLESPAMWGEAARLQKALNAPWHDLLQHWHKVQDLLLEFSHDQYMQTGAARRVMESTTPRWRALYARDPFDVREIGKHIAGSFDAYQRLIEARQAHGYVEKEGLEQLQDSIRNLMEDWNLGNTVAVARNKVAAKERDPRNFGARALQLAESLPMGVGGAVRAARGITEALSGDLHIQKGTALSDVWDRGLKRYAVHPELTDASLYQNLSPWMQDALRARGAAIPQPPSPGGVGMPAASPGGPPAPAGAGLGGVAKDIGGKVAGAGLFGLGASQLNLDGQRDPNAPAEAGLGPIGAIATGLMLMTRGGRVSLIQAMRNVKNVMSHRNLPAAAAWKVTDEMFEPTATLGKRFVERAIEIAEGRGVDLGSPRAERELYEALSDALPGGVLTERAEAALKETSKLSGAATRAAKLAPKKQAAVDLLGGEPFAERLAGKYGEDWYTSDWRGTVTQTFGSHGEPLVDVIKRRLKDPAPLALDDVARKVLGIKRKNLDPRGALDFHTFKRGAYPPELIEAAADAERRWGELAPLRKRIAEATAGLDDTFRKVDAEDNILREVLRDAVGMRAPVKRELDASVDATSRYRKAKKGFDTWREKALPPEELKATRTWQTHYYRSINADARMGIGAAKKAGGKLYGDLGWSSEEVADVSSRATAIGAQLLTALNKAVEAGRTVPGRVRRGISMSEEEAQRLLRAKTVTSQGFMSTSIHSSTPEGFAERRAGEFKEVPVMLEIEQRTGVPIGQGEGELTLRPGTGFHVVSAERTPDGWVRAYLRESEPSKITTEEYLKGIAGTIPTEAKIAGGLLAVGSALAPDDAAAAEESRAAGDASPELPELPEAPPKDETPRGIYRDALRGIREGGDSLVRSRASQALRLRQPKGRPALRAFTGRRSLDAAVDNARQAIQSLQDDPSALLDELGGSVGDLTRTHPSVYGALAAKTAGIIGYLAAEVPQRTGRTLLDPEGQAPSYDRSVEFAHKAVGALMPEQAMSDIARLDAPAEEVAAFRQNWGELWEGLRAELLGQVQRRYEAGRPVDGEKLRALDGLLGMNGQLDPSASLEVANQIITAASASPEAPAQNSPPSQSPSMSGRASGMLRTRLATSAMENQVG